MSYSPVNIGSNTDEGTLASLAISGASIPAGSIGIAIACETGSTSGTFSDGTNGWTLAAAVTDSAPSRLQVFYRYYPTAFSGTLTYTKNATADQSCVQAAYVRGIISADVAVTATATCVVANPPSMSVTSGVPSQIGDFILGAAGGQNNWNSAVSGWAVPAGWNANPPFGIVDSYVANSSRWCAGSWIANPTTATETFHPTVSAGGGTRDACVIVVGFKIKKSLAGFNMPMLGI